MKNKILVLSLVAVLVVGAGIGALTSDKFFSFADSKGQATSHEKEDDEVINVAVKLTEQEAKDIAVASVANGTFKAIELEDENGVIVYGVEVSDGSTTYDIKVDANSGALLKSDNDSDDEAVEDESEATEDEPVTVSVKLTEQEAKDIAVGSVANGTFKTIELEDENGVIVYGVKVSDGSSTLDIKVDANSGKILPSDNDVEHKDEN